MHDQLDQCVRELGSTRLRLRDDLMFTPQTSSSQPYYVAEDPLNSRFFRFGHAEYTFVSLLNGATTVEEAVRHLSTVNPNHCLTEADAAGLCRWLVDMDLAHTAESSQGTRLADAATNAAAQRALARVNPLVFRLPLGRPDAAFAGMSRWVGWLFSPLASVVWLLLVVVAAYRVLAEWDKFAASSQGIFSPDNWLWLAGCWVILKLAHEIAHGVVCKRYGGTVRETGILFILFAPLAYVDVTSSWRFRSRWQRIHVAMAGMYVELLIASIATFVWSSSGSGWLNNLCFNLFVMASITTLVFNANPLMRFDGYFILSDLLTMPNLYVNGQSLLRCWARRFLLGVPATLPDWSRCDETVIAVYGWASFAWRMLIFVGLTISAATLFHGAGIVLAAGAVLLWAGLPALRFFKYIAFGEPGEQPQRVRFFFTSGCIITLIVLVLGFVPWPGSLSAPAVVEYAPQVVIRASSPGFVREIRVKSDQQVQAGQLLVVMENRQLVRDLRDLELQIKQTELRAWREEQRGELAARQVEVEKRVALQRQWSELQTQVNQLEIRAPSAGKVVRRDLADLIDTYLEEGSEVVALGDESQKELRISVSQDDLHGFSRCVGKPIRISVPAIPTWHVQLEKVIPRATLQSPHRALEAVHGGPLPVKSVARTKDDLNSDAYELLSPRFTAVARIKPPESRQLHAGQLGTVSYRPLEQSTGQVLYNAVSRWVRGRLAH